MPFPGGHENFRTPPKSNRQETRPGMIRHLERSKAENRLAEVDQLITKLQKEQVELRNKLAALEGEDK